MKTHEFSTLHYPGRLSLGGRSLLLGGLAASLLGGCATSSPVVTSEPYASTTQQGIVYSLPKQLVSIGVVRELVDLDDLLAAVAKNQAAYAGLLKTATEAKAEYARITALLEQTTQADAKKALEEKQALAKAEWDVAAIKAKVALALLTQAQEELKDVQGQIQSGALAGGGSQVLRDTISVTPQAPVPDPTRTFVATPIHSPWRSDTFKLTTSAAGLLEGYKGSADDKTGEVILKIVDIYKGVAMAARKTATRIQSVEKAPDEKEVLDKYPFKYERAVDPTDPAALQNVGTDLHNLEADYQFELKTDPAYVAPALKPAPTGGSLYYRRPVLQILEVKVVGDDGISRFVQSVPLLLPNQGPIASIDISAAPMVKSDFDFAFKDGMLISFDSTKPSEMLAGFSLLADTVKGIVALPAEIVQLKINYSSKAQELSEKQKSELEAKVALLEAQKAADQKIADLATDSAGTP